MKTTAQMWGNSLGIRIPQAFAEEVGLKAGQTVELTIDKEGLHIRPARTRQTLAQMLSRVTPENLHSEIDWGPDVGLEVLEPYEGKVVFPDETADEK